MARNNKAEASGLGNFSLVNVDFSYDERLAINGWIPSYKFTLEDLVLSMIDTNWKLSFSYHSTQETYLASVTFKGKVRGKGTAPVYMIRHDDFEKLQYLVAYFWIHNLASGENVEVEPVKDTDW